MTKERIEMLLDAATDLLQELLPKATESQQAKILIIFNEMKYSDYIDEEMEHYREISANEE